MEILLPKLADYGVAALAIGMGGTILLRLVGRMLDTFGRVMNAEREQCAKDSARNLQILERVDGKVDGLHSKIDRLL